MDTKQNRNRLAHTNHSTCLFTRLTKCALFFPDMVSKTLSTSPGRSEIKINLQTQRYVHSLELVPSSVRQAMLLSVLRPIFDVIPDIPCSKILYRN